MAWGAVLGLAGAGISAGLQNRGARRSYERSIGRQDALLDDVRSGDFLGRYGVEDVFGTKPEAIPYAPVDYRGIDYGDVQLETLLDNLAAFDTATELTGGINEELTNAGIRRMDALAPGYVGGIGDVVDAAVPLARGQLPFDDVLDIVSDRNELTNMLGTPGTRFPATMRDLGLRRLDAMGMGANLLAQAGNLAEAVDPVSRQVSPASMMLSPSQTVPMAQQDAQFAAEFESLQRQLDQNAQQFAANIEAAPYPGPANMFSASYLNASTPPPTGGAAWGSAINAGFNQAADWWNSRNSQPTYNPGGAYSGPYPQLSYAPYGRIA